MSWNCLCFVGQYLTKIFRTRSRKTPTRSSVQQKQPDSDVAKGSAETFILLLFVTQTFPWALIDLCYDWVSKSGKPKAVTFCAVCLSEIDDLSVSFVDPDKLLIVVSSPDGQSELLHFICFFSVIQTHSTYTCICNAQRSCSILLVP